MSQIGDIYHHVQTVEGINFRIAYVLPGVLVRLKHTLLGTLDYMNVPWEHFLRYYNKISGNPDLINGEVEML